MATKNLASALLFKFSTRSLNRSLCSLAFMACASLATFQAAQANGVGWRELDHGGCGGGSTGLPCGLTNQTATFFMYDEIHPALLDQSHKTKSISITYDLTDMIVDSATLWIQAKDDKSGVNHNYADTGTNSDRSEQAAFTKIEGSTISTPTWTEINGLGWYIGLDVMNDILGSHASPLTALLAVYSSTGEDFWFKNAKLDIGYHTAPCPSPVPLPAAAWLFGSALLGFVSLSNRRRV